MTPISKTFNRDCLSAMREFPDRFFELAVVDPPYRDKNDPDQWLRAHKGNMKEWQAAPKGDYFAELFRVAKNQIIWGGNYFTGYLEANNNWIVWWKLNEGVHFSMCELAWCSIRKNVQLKRMPPDKNKIHETQKPVALYKWLLTNYAKQGDKILDTHLGSQSSRIAAYDLSFDFWGYELDTDYFNEGEKWFAEHIKQPKLFEPIFAEQKQETLF